MITIEEIKNCLVSSRTKKIKIFAKNPARGGMPEIEKKINIKEKACILLTLAKPFKLET